MIEPSINRSLRLIIRYYMDSGESVAHQPGVRPAQPTLIVGAEPHLHAASQVAAPPPEPSTIGAVGAAASFFNSTDDFQSLPPSRLDKPSKQFKTTGSSVAEGSLATLAGGTALSYAAGEIGGKPNSSLDNHSLSYQQISNTPTSNTYPSDVRPSSNFSHSSSVPILPTLGAAAAGAAAGYLVGDHSSQQHHPEHASSGGGPYGELSSSTTQRPQHPPSHVNSSYETISATDRPLRVGKQSSQSSSNPLYAAGAAGLATAAYQHNSHSSTQTSSAAQKFPSGSMAQRHRHRGPFGKFIEFWTDPDGVAQFEEYTEYIGVCRYCFAPGSSPRDAPRRHYYRRRGSNERFGSSTRVDKDSRYWSSDGENRRTNKNSWLATGIASYGLAKVGETLFKKDQDSGEDYSLKFGLVNRSDRARTDRHNRRSTERYNDKSEGLVRRSSKINSQHRSGSQERIETGFTSDGKIYRKDTRGGSFSGPSMTTFSPRRHSRSRSRSRSRDRKSGLAEAALGAAIGSTIVATNGQHRSRSPKKPFIRSEQRSGEHSPASGSIVGSSKSTSNRKEHRARYSPSSSYVDISRSSRRQDTGLLGGFFSSQSERRQKSQKKDKRIGFFGFSNVSSSSSDADLAFGTGYEKQKVSRRPRSKNNEHRNAEAALLGLGAAAAALAASESRKNSKSKQRADLVAVKENSGNHRRGPRYDHNRRDGSSTSSLEEDLWESASGDDSSSVHSGLAYGRLARKSQDSLISESSGMGKWGWRWGNQKKKRDVTRTSDHLNESSTPIVLGTTSIIADERHQAMRMSSSSSIPLQHVFPVPTSDPSRFEATMQSSVASPSLPIMVSRPGPIPIQQPQPVSSVSPAVYTTQTPHIHSYSAPSGPPVFAQDSYRSQHPPVHTRPNDFVDSAQPSIPGAFPRPEFILDARPKDLVRDSEIHRRDSSPAQFVAGFDLSSTSQRRRASTREEASTISFDLTKEQADRDRRESHRQRKDEENRQDQNRRREAEEQARLEMERRTSRGVPGRKAASQIKSHETNIRLEGSAYRRDPELREGSENSWAAPITVTVVGAAVGASIIGAEESSIPNAKRVGRREERRTKSNYSNENDTSTEGKASPEEIPDTYDLAERQARIVRQAAAKVRKTPSPSHEDYAAYFVPPEILSKSGEQRQIIGPNGDNDITSYQTPKIVTIEPSEFRNSPYPPAFLLDSANDEIVHRLSLPWQVPRLNLIEPTPPHSIAGSMKGDSSPIIRPDDIVVTHGEESPGPNSGSKVSWGDSETHEHTIIAPEDAPAPFIESFSEEGDEREVVPLTSIEASKSTQNESPINESRSQGQAQPKFGDDLEFAATLAAGLEDTGFDPSIVIDDSAFRRRDSPPGSEQAGIYRSPFAKTVASLSLESLGTEVAPPQQDSVEGELPQTPSDDYQRTIPGSYEEEAPAKLSKTNRKKKDKTFERQTLENISTDLDGNITQTDNSEISQEPREYLADAEPVIQANSSVINYVGDQQPSQKSSDYETVERDNAASVDNGVHPSLSQETERDEYYEAFETAKNVTKSGDQKNDREDVATTKQLPEVIDEAFDDPSKISMPDPAFDDQQVSKNLKSRKPKQDSTVYDASFEVVRPSEVRSTRTPTSSTESQSRASMRDSGDSKSIDSRIRSETMTDRSISGKRTKSKKYADDDDLYQSPSEDFSSAVRDAEPLSDPGDSKKSRKKSKRRSTDFDDLGSVISAPARVNSKDSRSNSKKDRKGGFLGLFSKSTDNLPESGRSKDTSMEASFDGFEEPKKKSKKSKDRKLSRDKEDVYSRASTSVTSLPGLLDNDDDSGKRRDVKDNKAQRRDPTSSVLQDSGRITQDLPVKVHKSAFLGRLPRTVSDELLTECKDYESTRDGDVTGMGPDSNDVETQQSIDEHKQMSFLDARPRVPPLPDIDDISAPPESKEEITVPPSVVSPGSMNAETNVPTHPESQRMLPVATETATDLPPLPASRLASPTDDFEDTARQLSDRQTPDSSHSANAAPSPTAIPFHFRKPPASPGFTRSHNPTSPATSAQSPGASYTRSRHGRPNSTEFKSSTEFRPLWLVEKHGSRQEPPLEEPYPSLPSSHSTSRSSSVHDPEENDLYQHRDDDDLKDPDDAFSPKNYGLAIDTSQDVAQSDLLDSQQPTPTAASFHSLSHLERSLEEASVRSPSVNDEKVALEENMHDRGQEERDGSPQRSDARVDKLFPSAHSGLRSDENYDHPQDLPPLPLSRASSPSQYEEHANQDDSSTLRDALAGLVVGGTTATLLHTHALGEHSEKDIKLRAVEGEEFTTLSAAKNAIVGGNMERSEANRDLMPRISNIQSRVTSEPSNEPRISNAGEDLERGMQPESSSSLLEDDVFQNKDMEIQHYEPNRETESFGAEEMRQMQEKDAQDAMNSWSVPTSKKSIKDRKGKKKRIISDNVNQSHSSSMGTAPLSRVERESLPGDDTQIIEKHESQTPRSIEETTEDQDYATKPEALSTASTMLQEIPEPTTLTRGMPRAQAVEVMAASALEAIDDAPLMPQDTSEAKSLADDDQWTGFPTKTKKMKGRKGKKKLAEAALEPTDLPTAESAQTVAKAASLDPLDSKALDTQDLTSIGFAASSPVALVDEPIPNDRAIIEQLEMPGDFTSLEKKTKKGKNKTKHFVQPETSQNLGSEGLIGEIIDKEEHKIDDSTTELDQVTHSSQNRNQDLANVSGSVVESLGEPILIEDDETSRILQDSETLNEPVPLQQDLGKRSSSRTSAEEILIRDKPRDDSELLAVEKSAGESEAHKILQPGDDTLSHLPQVYREVFSNSTPLQPSRFPQEKDSPPVDITSEVEASKLGSRQLTDHNMEISDNGPTEFLFQSPSPQVVPEETPLPANDDLDLLDALPQSPTPQPKIPVHQVEEIELPETLQRSNILPMYDEVTASTQDQELPLLAINPENCGDLDALAPLSSAPFLEPQHSDTTAEESRPQMGIAAFNADQPLGETGKTPDKQIPNEDPEDFFPSHPKKGKKGSKKKRGQAAGSRLAVELGQADMPLLPNAPLQVGQDVEEQKSNETGDISVAREPFAEDQWAGLVQEASRKGKRQKTFMPGSNSESSSPRSTLESSSTDSPKPRDIENSRNQTADMPEVISDARVPFNEVASETNLDEEADLGESKSRKKKGRKSEAQDQPLEPQEPLAIQVAPEEVVPEVPRSLTGQDTAQEFSKTTEGDLHDPFFKHRSSEVQSSILSQETFDPGVYHTISENKWKTSEEKDANNHLTQTGEESPNTPVAGSENDEAITENPQATTDPTSEVQDISDEQEGVPASIVPLPDFESTPRLVAKIFSENPSRDNNSDASTQKGTCIIDADEKLIHRTPGVSGTPESSSQDNVFSILEEPVLEAADGLPMKSEYRESEESNRKTISTSPDHYENTVESANMSPSEADRAPSEDPIHPNVFVANSRPDETEDLQGFSQGPESSLSHDNFIAHRTPNATTAQPMAYNEAQSRAAFEAKVNDSPLDSPRAIDTRGSIHTSIQEANTLEKAIQSRLPEDEITDFPESIQESQKMTNKLVPGQEIPKTIRNEEIQLDNLQPASPVIQSRAISPGDNALPGITQLQREAVEGPIETYVEENPDTVNISSGKKRSNVSKNAQDLVINDESATVIHQDVESEEPSGVTQQISKDSVAAAQETKADFQPEPDMAFDLKTNKKNKKSKKKALAFAWDDEATSASVSSPATPAEEIQAETQPEPDTAFDLKTNKKNKKKAKKAQAFAWDNEAPSTSVSTPATPAEESVHDTFTSNPESSRNSAENATTQEPRVVESDASATLTLKRNKKDRKAKKSQAFNWVEEAIHEERPLPLGTSLAEAESTGPPSTSTTQEGGGLLLKQLSDPIYLPRISSQRNETLSAPESFSRQDISEQEPGQFKQDKPYIAAKKANGERALSPSLDLIQPTAVAGSPTALLFTGASHEDVSIAEEQTEMASTSLLESVDIRENDKEIFSAESEATGKLYNTGNEDTEQRDKPDEGANLWDTPVKKGKKGKKQRKGTLRASNDPDVVDITGSSSEGALREPIVDTPETKQIMIAESTTISEAVDEQASTAFTYDSPKQEPTKSQSENKEALIQGTSTSQLRDAKPNVSAPERIELPAEAQSNAIEHSVEEIKKPFFQPNAEESFLGDAKVNTTPLDNGSFPKDDDFPSFTTTKKSKKGKKGKKQQQPVIWEDDTATLPTQDSEDATADTLASPRRVETSTPSQSFSQQPYPQEISDAQQVSSSEISSFFPTADPEFSHDEQAFAESKPDELQARLLSQEIDTGLPATAPYEEPLNAPPNQLGRSMQYQPSSPDFRRQQDTFDTGSEALREQFNNAAKDLEAYPSEDFFPSRDEHWEDPPSEIGKLHERDQHESSSEFANIKAPSIEFETPTDKADVAIVSADNEAQEPCSPVENEQQTSRAPAASRVSPYENEAVHIGDLASDSWEGYAGMNQSRMDKEPQKLSKEIDLDTSPQYLEQARIPKQSFPTIPQERMVMRAFDKPTSPPPHSLDTFDNPPLPSPPSEKRGAHNSRELQASAGASSLDASMVIAESLQRKDLENDGSKRKESKTDNRLPGSGREESSATEQASFPAGDGNFHQGITEAQGLEQEARFEAGEHSHGTLSRPAGLVTEWTQNTESLNPQSPSLRPIDNVNRDSAIHFADSPLFQERLPIYRSVRDSGYQDTEASPVAATDSQFHTTNMEGDIAGGVDGLARDHSADSYRRHVSSYQHSMTAADPLNISVEVDPDYDVSVSRGNIKRGRRRATSGSDNDKVQLPLHETWTHLSGDARSPELVSYDARQPSPIDSTTRERSSVLFRSSPSTREDALFQPESPGSRHDEPVTGQSADRTDFEGNRNPFEASQSRDGSATDKHSVLAERASSLAALSVSSELDEEQRPSIFGGPTGVNSDVVSPPRSPFGGRLNTIEEYSPEESPLHKKGRAVSDVGSPERGVKAARRSATPQALLHQRVRSPHVTGPEGKRLISTDDLIARLSWPAVDEEKHAINLERSRSRDTDHRPSSRHSNVSGLPSDGANLRSFSGASVRSGESINAIIRTPEGVHSVSGVSNRSSATPPLRRVDRSISGDLRAANRKSSVKAASEAETEIATPTIPPSSTYDPIKDKGKSRVRDMADVYVSPSH